MLSKRKKMKRGTRPVAFWHFARLKAIFERGSFLWGKDEGGPETPKNHQNILNIGDLGGYSNEITVDNA